MAGIQEVFTLILVITLIIFIPKIFRKEKKIVKKEKAILYFSGKMRLAIVLSATLPIIAGLILKPWQNHFFPFISFGILPVLAGWAGFWIFSGFNKSIDK